MGCQIKGQASARVCVSPDAEYIFAKEVVLVRIDGGLAYFGLSLPELIADSDTPVEIEASKIFVLPSEAVMPFIWLTLSLLGETAKREIRRFAQALHH